MSWLDDRERKQLEFLGLSIATADQRRRKATGILLGMTGLLCAYMVGVYFVEQWQVVQTRQQVVRWAEQLTHTTDALEVYDPQGDYLSEQDVWGKPVRVKVELAGKHLLLIVSSDGPDKQSGTKDDITAKARIEPPQP